MTKKSFEIWTKLLWDCSETALRLPWNYPKNCPEYALKMLGMAVKLVQNCSEIALKLLWDCSEIALKWLWNGSEIALKLLWYCTGIAPKLLQLHWNYSGRTETALIALRLHWSCSSCTKTGPIALESLLTVGMTNLIENFNEDDEEWQRISKESINSSKNVQSISKIRQEFLQESSKMSHFIRWISQPVQESYTHLQSSWFLIQPVSKPHSSSAQMLPGCYLNAT